MNTSEQFKINPEGFTEYRKEYLRKSLPIILLLVITGVATSYYNTKDSDILPIFFSLVLISAVMVYTLYRQLKRQKQLLKEWTLTISDEYITREMPGWPTITIPVSGVSLITKHKKGNFIIRENGTSNAIAIPRTIDNYDKLENKLNAIKPVSIIVVTPWYQKYNGILSIAAIGFMIATYTSSNKIVTGVCGTAIISLLVYSYVVIQKNKNVSDRIKRSAWIFLVVILSTLYTVILKLSH